MSDSEEYERFVGKLMAESEHIIFRGENVTGALGEATASDSLPIYKRVSRHWKHLPERGDDVTIKDPKLRQGYLGDLRKKTIIELEDVLRRLDESLNQRTLLLKLPDKGERIRKKRQEVAEALEEVREKERNLKARDLHVDVQALEWRGTNKSRKHTNERNRIRRRETRADVDSDDERLDPLELMAQHSSIIKERHHRKSWSDEEDPADVIIRELEQMELRDAQQSASDELKRTDEGEAESSAHREQPESESTAVRTESPNHSSLDFGTKRIQMLELRRLRNGEVREPFKPFRRLEHPQPLPDIQDIIDSHRPKSDREAQLISLQESITLERDYLSKTKERELKKTTEVLTRMKNEKIEIGLPPTASSLKYRDVNISKHLLDSDEEDNCYLPAHSDYYDDEDDELDAD